MIMAKPQHRGITATMVAIMVVVGALGVDFYVLVNGLPRAEGASHDAVIMILTAWNGLALNVVSYFFGNSANSDRKTELMAQAPAIPVPGEVKADSPT